jgi:hypothetical protein
MKVIAKYNNEFRPFELMIRVEHQTELEALFQLSRLVTSVPETVIRQMEQMHSNPQLNASLSSIESDLRAALNDVLGALSPIRSSLVGATVAAYQNEPKIRSSNGDDKLTTAEAKGLSSHG